MYGKVLDFEGFKHRIAESRRLEKSFSRKKIMACNVILLLINAYKELWRSYRLLSLTSFATRKFFFNYLFLSPRRCCTGQALNF